MRAVLVAVVGLSCLAAGIKWIRVGQVEHYLPGSATSTARRWARAKPSQAVFLALLLAGVGISFALSWLAAVVAVCAVVWPVGLKTLGRAKKLRWTRRARSLAAVYTTVTAGLALLDWLFVPVPLLAGAAVLSPLLVDLCLWLAAPLEKRLALRYVVRAKVRLREIGPTVIGVTGSFGKTSTKELIAQLVGRSLSVVASPASFNNQAGLTRTVLEHLQPGTEVLVAEMGAYGPGEIRALCQWLAPTIGVITAIGPMHLERMGTVANVVRAKSEIVEGAQIAVLNVDQPELKELADQLAATDKRIIRCSALDPTADVYVSAVATGLQAQVNGEVSPVFPHQNVFATNLACALGVGLALGVPTTSLFAGLQSLDNPVHRRRVATSAAGVAVVDDTYNSNPEGASAALALLRDIPADQRFVITPGMVELGPQQVVRNVEFGRQAAEIADYLLIVGRTNRTALKKGAAATATEVVVLDRLDQAVAWMNAHAHRGDAVLYENDLPDHYP